MKKLPARVKKEERLKQSLRKRKSLFKTITEIELRKNKLERKLLVLKHEIFVIDRLIINIMPADLSFEVKPFEDVE